MVVRLQIIMKKKRKKKDKHLFKYKKKVYLCFPI